MILNLLVGVPAYRSQVNQRHSNALAELRIACMMSEAREQAHMRNAFGAKHVLPSAQPVGFRWCGKVEADTCDLGHNRNSFVQAAIDGVPIIEGGRVHPTKRIPIHWLLMIDADIYQDDPGPVFRMLTDAWARNAPAVAAPVMRRDGWLNVLGDADTPMTRAEVRDKVQEIRRIGTGFFAVNVPWIAEHWPWDEHNAWFQFVPTTRNGKPHTLGEDFCFCSRLTATHGARVLCDGRFEPRHEGAPEDECRTIARG